MKTKTYDVIIVGCGPAGMACGLKLAGNGLSCLILEKQQSVGNKVCGDALSVEGRKCMDEVGLDTDTLLEAGGRIIRSHIVTGDEKVLEQGEFGENEYAIGISRRVFDNLLLGKVRDAGIDVILGEEARQIVKRDETYCVNDRYSCRRVVIAAGAAAVSLRRRGEVRYMPVGMSARINARLPLKDDCFYVQRDSSYRGGYSWIFPVGRDLWNIGVWTPDNSCKKSIKKAFYEFEKREIKKLTYDYTYERKPGGAVIGAYHDPGRDRTEAPDEESSDHGEISFIGDSALRASSYTGEGISFAIRSGTSEAERIVKELKKQTTY